MTETLSRRKLMALGLWGAGGLILPAGYAAAQALGALRGFTHGVASGEPQADSVLLWTRYVPETSETARVRVELSQSADFTKVAGGGQMITGPWRDHTVKITVDGLLPGTRYYYRFIGPDGTISETGRTKTLPVGSVKQFNIVVFSCSNYGYGYFNGYGHAAARQELDLAIHLGDYIYEQKRGGYDRPGFSRGADLFPERELLDITDYRLRYATYRSDPDLRALHRAVAVIPNTDDHEGANDGWEGGAQNHQPDEGSWTNRRNAAMQAWREWMPVGEQPWQSYDIGTLATYLRTDSRLIARSRPPALGEILAGQGDAQAALKAFRDGPWQDPAATMFGTEQESWITHALQASTRRKAAWQIVGNGTVMGDTRMPLEAEGWIDPKLPAFARNWTLNGIAAAKADMPFNLDNWGGYPLARARMLKSAQATDSDLIMLAGDSHNAWAYDLAQDGKAAGVEFAVQSVSSPGYENSTRADPAIVAAATIKASPELRWCDTSNRGYMMLSLTPTAATNQWVFMDQVTTRSLAAKGTYSKTVKRGRRVLDAA
jgi:alkaline phosphatase D